MIIIITTIIIPISFIIIIIIVIIIIQYEHVLCISIVPLPIWVLVRFAVTYYNHALYMYHSSANCEVPASNQYPMWVSWVYVPTHQPSFLHQSITLGVKVSASSVTTDWVRRTFGMAACMIFLHMFSDPVISTYAEWSGFIVSAYSNLPTDVIQS